MADLERTVAIIFEGVDQMGAGVDSATKRMDSLISGAQNVTGPMAGATTSLLKFEAGLLTAGAGVTAMAIKLAGDFDTQFREISTLLDEPTEAVSKFRGEVKAYASESTQEMSEVNSAIYNAISAGVDYTDSLDVVRQAEKLAVAGKAELGQSLTVLVSSLNAYGEGMDQAEKYSDLLFQTVKSGQTTLPELGGALANVTDTAASAGVSFDEVLSAIAAITSGGAPTSQAITRVQAAISTLIKPTKDASSLAEELGIEFNATALESKGLHGVLRDVEEATGGNVEQIGRLFSGQEAFNGVLALSGKGAERFAENLNSMAGSAGATQAAYDEMVDSIDNNNQRIINAMKGALVAVGDPLLDEFGGIQEAIAAIFNAIGASVSGGQLAGFVDQLEDMMGGIEQTMLNVAQNLPEALEGADYSAFFDGLDAIKDAVASLFDGADLTSAEGLTQVIETLGAGFNLLSQFTAGAIESIGPFLSMLGDLLEMLSTLDPKLVLFVGTVGGLAVALDAILSVGGVVVKMFGTMAGSKGLGAVTLAIKPLVALLSGPVGLAAAVAFAGKGLYDMVSDFATVGDSADEARAKFEEQNEAIRDGTLVYDYAVKDYVAAADAQETLADRTDAMNKMLREAVQGMSDEEAARRRQANMMSDVNAKYFDYEGAVEDAWKASDSFAESQDKTAASLRKTLEGIGPLSTGIEELSKGVYGQTTNLEALEDGYGKVQAAFDDGLIDQAQFDELTGYFDSLKNGSEDGAKAQKALAGEVLTTEEAIVKARQKVLDYELSMEELASNERLKSLELSVDFKTAQMEADAKKVESILNATSETIASTADAAASMFGSLGSDDLGLRDRMMGRDAIDQQLTIQKEAAEQQGKLIDAQVEQMRAKTKALQSGDGLIKIESDGLEPALEMIMWNVIEKVQMRANAEGAEFLLGL